MRILLANFTESNIMKGLYKTNLKRVGTVQLIFVCLLFFVTKTNAQIFPENGLVLNHTQIMFQYPQAKGAQVYKIQISTEGSADFDKNIVYEAKDSSIAHLVKEKLKFGTTYHWRYFAYKDNKKIFSSKEFLFETAKTKVETNFRANITKYDPTKVLDGLLFLDNGLAMDRKGNVVLISDSFGTEKRDFNLNSSGSITYVKNGEARELDLNGKVIWQSPKINTDKLVVFDFHHDVTKLKNGNYLSLCKVNEPKNPKFRQKYNEAIIELDVKNNIVWLWKENDHIMDTAAFPATHLNSIFVDEKENKIFVSSRDLNCFFVVNRTTGKIDECIGYKMNNETDFYPQPWFSGQHHVQLLESGNIILFNNNTMAGRGNTTSIMEITRPTKNKKEIEMVFVYFYDFGKGENFCAKGGGINKLKNNNYLVSSSAYNRNFEMTPSQEIVWECRPERLDTLNKLWSGAGSYRISFIETLYPSFFTLESVYKNDNLTAYKIVNKGSSNDEYEICIKDANGNDILKKNVSILAGRNYVIPFDPAKNFEIKVTPKSNLNNYKEIKNK